MAGEQRYKTILLFGAPGSGKGTQGKVLGAVPGFFHLSCGDVFRALDRESELGKVFLEYSTQGKLVPDEFTVRLWQEHVDALVAAGQFKPEKEVLILDGIPRNPRQAEMMADRIDVNLLLYLEAADEEQMVERLRGRALKEDRPDDADEEVIRQRFREYEAESVPVLDAYPADRTRRVDAGGTLVEVVQGVLRAVQESGLA